MSGEIPPRTPGADRVPRATEPCLACGEETAVGSVFYSDRHTAERTDGTRSYLCSLCDAHLRASGRGRRLTDEEVRNAVENGSLAAITWASRGYLP